MAAEAVITNLRDAGLSDVLYMPDEENYNARVASYWSLTAQLKPWAIVQPRNTHEVSWALKAIVSVPEVKFAIRSGGHMPSPGASDITDGITIDLGLLNSISYDEVHEIASLQPGGTWAKTYLQLEKFGRIAAGGREGNVGIGGLLTGGGKTFYTCRVGFACDQMFNYEVVLADGSIVHVNAETNPDLFRVLKGGGNNFGIVTRFDMLTFPAKDVWDCTITINKRQVSKLADVFVDFTRNLTKEHFVLVTMMNLDGEKEPDSLRDFLDIPLEKDENSTLETGDGFYMAPGYRKENTFSIGTKLNSFVVPSGNHDTWYTLTFKAGACIILKANDVFGSLIETLKEQIPEHNFYFSMVLQPLPASFGAISASRGGNMMGLDRLKDDAILLVWGISVPTEEMNATIGRPALKGAIDKIRRPVGELSQENVKMMKEVAKKYDPEGVFQQRVPGGFKVSKVGTVG